jgi:hypothetical protein
VRKCHESFLTPSHLEKQTHLRFTFPSPSPRFICLQILSSYSTKTVSGFCGVDVWLAGWNSLPSSPQICDVAGVSIFRSCLMAVRFPIELSPLSDESHACACDVSGKRLMDMQYRHVEPPRSQEDRKKELPCGSRSLEMSCGCQAHSIAMHSKLTVAPTLPSANPVHAPTCQYSDALRSLTLPRGTYS